MADIGAKISLDGSKAFKDDLKQITQQGKTLSAQMNTLASSFSTADNKEEALRKATENLDKQIENQKNLVDKLSDAVNKSAAEKGEDATETLKLKQQLANAQTTLNNLNNTTAESALGMDKLGDEEKEAGDNANTASGKMSAFAVALGQLAADAIKQGLKNIVDGLKNIVKFFGEAVTGAADFADEMSTLSTQTGLSTTTLQEYKYMASLTDVELETITGSLTKLEKSMGSANDESSDAAKTFKSLGVAVKKDDGTFRSANDVFQDTITALGGIDDEVERDNIAMKLFGKSAKQLNPLIEKGGDALDDLRQEAHDVGYVLDNETIDALGGVKDGFDRLKLAGESLKNKLGATLGKFILPYLERLVSAVQALLNTGDVDAFVNSISGMLNDMLQAITDALPKVLEAGGKILGQLIMGINDALPQLVPAALNIITSIVTFLTENLPKIADTALEIILALVTGIGQQLPQLIPAVISMILTIVENLLGNVGQIIDAALKLIDGLVNGLTSEEGLQKIIQAVPQLIIALITGIIENLPDILASGVDIVANLITGIISAIPDLVLAMPQLIEAIVIAFRDYDWSKIGKQMSSKLKEGFQAAKDKIVAAGKSAINYLRDGIKERWDALKTVAGGFVTRIKEGINAKIDELKTKGKEFISKVKSGVMERIDDLRTTAQTFISRIGQGISEKWDDLKTKGSDLVEKVKTGISNALDTIKEIGKDLVVGLWNGINDKVQWIKEKIKGFTDTITSWMKKLFGISSPSKVMENEVGQWLTYGIADGFENAMPSAEAQMQNSLDGLLNSLQSDMSFAVGTGGMAVQSTAGSTTNLGGVNIVVNAAEGQDASAIADMVMRRMQEAVNARRAVFA